MNPFRKGVSSHNMVLIRALACTTGPVLELGCGYFSTPLLHWLCAEDKRRLVSYENDPTFFAFARKFKSRNHSIRLVSSYDDAPVERAWDVAFVDHAAERRKIEIARLAPHARFVVVHDTDEPDAIYNYNEIYPLFKYRFDYTKHIPWTSILSNFVEFQW